MWYEFGRSQAIKDTFKDKIVVNTTIKDVDSIKITRVPAGSGVYSGLYLLTSVDFDKICSILKSEDFIRYIKALNKCKSGGYFTFSSKDLGLYLNYKLSKESN